MVVYHKYERGKHSGHDHGTCRIWSKVSRDGGGTWQQPRMLVDVAEGDMNVQAQSVVAIVPLVAVTRRRARRKKVPGQRESSTTEGAKCEEV